MHSSAQGDANPHETYFWRVHKLSEIVVHSDVLLLCVRGASSKWSQGDTLVEAQSSSKSVLFVSVFSGKVTCFGNSCLVVTI